jgi:hypothetical protein
MPSAPETWTVESVRFVEAHTAVLFFEDGEFLEVACREETCDDWLSAARKEVAPNRIRVSHDCEIDDDRPDPGFPSRYYAERELEERRGW